jgi:hypothetical protein
MDNVNYKAFKMPVVRHQGKDLTPVVVTLEQGATASAKEKKPALVGVGPSIFDPIREFFNRDRASEPEDNSRNPLRIFHLVDVSSSMRGRSGQSDLSKLDFVKSQFSELREKLPEGIQHELIPYSGFLHLKDGGSYDNARALSAAVDNLRIYQGTIIEAPIQEALSQISNNPNTPEDTPYRNLIHLVSDGQNMGDNCEVKSLASSFQDHNAGVFTTGVGLSYSERFMNTLLQKGGFGMSTHIPMSEDVQSKNKFTSIFPRFVRELVSAPHFPIVGFNAWFDKVVNLNPSLRSVEPCSDLKDPFYLKAAIGYQNKGLVVGFVENDSCDKARINIDIKDRANGKSLETKDIPIQDFDTLGLDPKDQELIREAPYKALVVELLQSRDLYGIQKFLEENAEAIDPKISAKFISLIHGLRTSVDDNLDRSIISAVSVNHTMGGPREKEPGNGETMLATADEIKWTIDDARKLAPPIQVNDKSVLNNGAREVFISEINVDKKFSSANPVIANFNGRPIGNFVIPKSGNVAIGRSSSNDLVIHKALDSVSRMHAEIIEKDGELYLRDRDSSNGTFINSGQIQGEALLKSGDTIHLSPALSFKIEFA